ncbi:MAG: hypothetical protein IJZ90_04405 [Clostridia bacterium]|nr:hypothetical protein [Clostridia bacterium]
MDLSDAGEILNTTAGHDSGSHKEYAFIDGKRRVFIPENYMDSAGMKVKSKVEISLEDYKIILKKTDI